MAWRLRAGAVWRGERGCSRHFGKWNARCSETFMTYDVIVDGKHHRLELTQGDELTPGERIWLCRIDGKDISVDAALTARDVLSIVVDGKAYEIKREFSLRGEVHIVLGSARYSVEVRDPRSLRTRRASGGAEAGPQRLTAPMPGKIVRVAVQAGEEVKAGQPVIVMEAMKMQNEMKSPKDGKVQKVLTAEGAAVNAGDTLAIIE